MNFHSVWELFLLIEIVNSSQNVIAKRLLVLLGKIGLNLGQERHWLVGCKDALQRIETNKFLRVIISELLRCDQRVWLLSWPSFLSADSVLTRLRSVVNNIGRQLDWLSCEYRANWNFRQDLAFVVANVSSVFTKVSDNINVRNWKTFWLNVDCTFNVGHLLGCYLDFNFFLWFWIEHDILRLNC